MEDRQKIVIRKVVKKSHGESHGGSWKVAYADFVTAMMAFFLLLWLLAMVSPEKRIALSQYFNSVSIFKSQDVASGTSMLDKNSGVIDMGLVGPKGQPRSNLRSGSSMLNENTHPLDTGQDPSKDSARSAMQQKVDPVELAKTMRMAIDDKLRFLKNQVYVDMTDEGVRIQIVDNEGSEVFRLGSDEPTEKAKQIIRLVADNLRDKPNRIVIEGHTDAAPFKNAQKTNWELSSLRASAARRELENDGIDSSRVARVVGYADQDLFIKENPRDLRNRRISIILLR